MPLPALFLTIAARARMILKLSARSSSEPSKESSSSSESESTITSKDAGTIPPDAGEDVNETTKKALIAGGVGALAGLAAKSILSDKRDPPGLARSEPLIRKLHPSIQDRARETLVRAFSQGVSLIVTQGLRTNEEQARLYAQGRTAPGAIVTNAPPGSSWHNFGLAFDVAVLDDMGKTTWPENSALWQKIGTIGKSTGCAWGGDWTTIKDRPHFEYHPGLTLADARAGGRPVA